MFTRYRSCERVPQQVHVVRGPPLQAPARRRQHRPGRLGTHVLSPLACPPPSRREGRPAGRLGFDDAARERWWQLYPALSEPEPGLLGAATARAEAHVVRLALLYVLFEGADRISLAHLDAAVALWDYAARSARWVFGGTLGAGVDAR